MTPGRQALVVGAIVGLALDLVAYATTPGLRGIFAHNHWVFYLYVAVIGGLAAAGVAYAALWIWSQLSSEPPAAQPGRTPSHR